MKLPIKRKVPERILYLDGLRGIAMAMVVLNHFAAAFYPAILFGKEASYHNSIELIIYKTPLNFFFSGIFAVCLFFILSGYFLSYKYFRFSEIQPLIPTIIRRYFSLAIPTMCSTIIAYFLLRNHLFYNLAISSTTGSLIWFANFWKFNANFFNAVTEGLFMSSIFIGNKTYNPVLWMMGYELAGSFLIYMLLKIFKFTNKRLFIYCLLLIVTFSWKGYLMGFILGIIICDLEFKSKINFSKYKSRILGTTLLILAIILGSFPISSTKGTIFEFIKIPFFSDTKNIVIFQMTAACLMILAIKNSNFFKRTLELPLFTFLGKISFSAFFLHLLIIGSVSSFLFKAFSNYLSYNMSFILTFVLSLPVILLAAFYFHKYIITNSLRFANYIKRYTSLI
jgi:peptidoglycan/LPS O-acetylase OafA/YrhL